MNFLLDPAIAIYVAMATALLVWLGVFALLWRIDRQARALRAQLDATEQPIERPAPRATLEKRPETASAPRDSLA